MTSISDDLFDMRLKDIKLGMSADYSQTITDADVKNFAGFSGDNNPMHVSDEYAEKSRYKKRIAHGLLSASFFSAIFGTKLPGKGCVYVSQNLNFKRPVYIGDTVTAKVEVVEVNEKKKIITFNTTCKVRGKLVIDGKAEIYIPEEKNIT